MLAGWFKFHFGAQPNPIIFENSSLSTRGHYSVTNLLLVLVSVVVVVVVVVVVGCQTILQSSSLYKTLYTMYDGTEHKPQTRK